jgi:hypothetical protein
VRRITKTIRREMKRRATVEPVIGHLQAEHRIRRSYLKGRAGDRINAVLAAAGDNVALLLRWLKVLLRALFKMLVAADRQTQLAEIIKRQGSSRTTPDGFSVAVAAIRTLCRIASISRLR